MATGSLSICDLTVSFDDIKLLLINIDLPFEDGNARTDEFTSELSVIGDILTYCHTCRRF